MIIKTLLSLLLLSSIVACAPSESDNTTETPTEQAQLDDPNSEDFIPEVPPEERIEHSEEEFIPETPPEERSDNGINGENISSFVGCFEKNDETENSVARTTLHIAESGHHTLSEAETYEHLDFANDTPEVTQEQFVIKIKSIEGATLRYERFYQGNNVGAPGGYTWKNGSFFIIDRLGNEVGPFKVCVNPTG